MKIKQTFIAIFCLLTIGLGAQDMQYSYWQFSPISYNPAFTGVFYGNLRLNGLVRDQWRTVSVSGQEYRTLSLSFDGNIPFGLKEGDWISAGMSMVKDQVGATSYKHSFSGLSVAYHLTLGKDQTTVLTLGGKYGTYSKGTKKGEYTSGFILSGAMSPDLDINGLNTGGNETSDLMIGLMLYTPMGKTSDLRVGFAMDHALQPNLSVTQDTSNVQNPISRREKLERRMNIHAQFYTDLSDKVTFNPTILYQKMGPASNILVQGMFSYAFNPEKEIYLNAGTGIRLADNSFIPLYFGADIKDWRFGVSYSINMGGLSQAAKEGGFEIAASKVFSWNKKAQVKPKFVCPRL